MCESEAFYTGTGNKVQMYRADCVYRDRKKSSSNPLSQHNIKSQQSNLGKKETWKISSHRRCYIHVQSEWFQMSWISFCFIVHQGIKGARRHREQVTGVSRVCAVKNKQKKPKTITGIAVITTLSSHFTISDHLQLPFNLLTC